MDLAVLFFAPLFAGVGAYAVPKPNHNALRLLLVFAGVYFFGVTFEHAVPPLRDNPADIPWSVLAFGGGFFLQYSLTGGFSSVPTLGAGRSWFFRAFSESSSVLILLSLHAFLEGGIVAQMIEQDGATSHAALLGIIMHHVPAAFVGMTVFLARTQSHFQAMASLILFSLAAPAGLFFGGALPISERFTLILYALMGGSLFYAILNVSWKARCHYVSPWRWLFAVLAGLSLTMLLVD